MKYEVTPINPDHIPYDLIQYNKLYYTVSNNVIALKTTQGLFTFENGRSVFFHSVETMNNNTYLNTYKCKRYLTEKETLTLSNES